MKYIPACSQQLPWDDDITMTQTPSFGYELRRWFDAFSWPEHILSTSCSTSHDLHQVVWSVTPDAYVDWCRLRRIQGRPTEKRLCQCVNRQIIPWTCVRTSRKCFSILTHLNILLEKYICNLEATVIWLVCLSPCGLLLYMPSSSADIIIILPLSERSLETAIFLLILSLAPHLKL